MAAIERSKEGVPQWDGSASTFQEYSELAEHWEQTVPYHKRYLCGPKLLNELSGTARRFILSKRPGWLPMTVEYKPCCATFASISACLNCPR